MVLEKPLQLQPERTDTVVNPCFIAEVLSKSTQDYDRGEKFVAYRTIDNFREYLLVDQYSIHVEHYMNAVLINGFSQNTMIQRLPCLLVTLNFKFKS